ncbi:methyl-accepting chemotaxis protein [Methylobacillus sp.]|uniref:methyl-accepting chemotaxis protein n=1 Tax=Methylobacillus sp. TaxID=56818 RepID=UPI002FE2EB4E
MKQFLKDITVHRMVIIMLIFISILFITLAGLSLKNLNNANSRLESHHRLLQQSETLSQANNQLMQARLHLSRQSEYLALDAKDASRAESLAAANALAKAEASFNTFLQHADGQTSQDIKAQYQALAQNGLHKLAQLLDSGNLEQARQHDASSINAASQQFGDTIATFNSRMEQQYQTMMENTRSDRRLMMVILGGVLALFLVLLLLADRYIVHFVRTPLDQVKEYFQKIADGDLTFHIALFGKNCPGQIYPYLIDMKNSLARTVGTVREGVEQINTGTNEIASGNNDLSRRTEQQASSLEETATSMEELAQTVANNADHARTASNLMQDATSVATRSEATMAEVVKIMQEINTQSRQIEEITSMIDGIAFQTNILALNAAVEAARAGEQGKGFAVVASEVRSLAQRSASAAREIKTLIVSSSEVVNAGTRQVTAAGETIHEVATSVNQVATMIEEIANASREQADGIAQVKVAISIMDEATQQNAALVEEAAATASALDNQANNLRQAVQIFKIG